MHFMVTPKFTLHREPAITNVYVLPCVTSVIPLPLIPLSSLLFFLHFLVLTSLSIRALRVLCTSSPSLSISAFNLSFWSVSSCTFLSFSCSLSLLLFFAEVEDECEPEEGKDRELPLLRLSCRDEENEVLVGEEGGEQLREVDGEAEEEQEGESGMQVFSSSLAEGDSGCWTLSEWWWSWWWW